MTRIQIPPMPDPGSMPPARTISIYGNPEAQQRALHEINEIIALPPGQPSVGSGGGQYGAPNPYGGGQFMPTGFADPYAQQQQQQYAQQQQQWQQYYQQQQ